MTDDTKPKWESKDIGYDGMVNFLKEAREVLNEERQRLEDELKGKTDARDVETTE